jgi:hypothetical protein
MMLFPVPPAAALNLFCADLFPGRFDYMQTPPMLHVYCFSKAADPIADALQVRPSHWTMVKLLHLHRMNSQLNTSKHASFLHSISLLLSSTLTVCRKALIS